MSLSIITLALAKQSAKKKIDKAMEKAIAAAKAYTDEQVSHIVSIRVEIVEQLPPISEADPHVIYFVHKPDPSKEADVYYEYMVIDNQWELIGSTELDLTNYWTIDEVKEYVQSQTYVLPAATTETLGGVKPDGVSTQTDNVGTLSVVEQYVQDVSGNTAQDIIDENFIRVTDDEIDDLFNN